MSTPDSLQALLEDSRQNKAEIAALRIVVDALIQTHPDSTPLLKRFLCSLPVQHEAHTSKDQIALVEAALGDWKSRISRR